MANEHFYMSWNGYKDSFYKGLSSLQQNGEFVDMTLAADGHLVKVHQMVIALASPYLKELINSAKCPHPIIFLNKVSYSTLCTLLEYIYMGEALVSKENIEEVVLAAKELHIQGLKNMKIQLTGDDMQLLTQLRELKKDTNNSGSSGDKTIFFLNDDDDNSNNLMADHSDGVATDDDQDSHSQSPAPSQSPSRPEQSPSRPDQLPCSKKLLVPLRRLSTSLEHLFLPKIKSESKAKLQSIKIPVRRQSIQTHDDTQPMSESDWVEEKFTTPVPAKKRRKNKTEEIITSSPRELQPGEMELQSAPTYTIGQEWWLLGSHYYVTARKRNRRQYLRCATPNCPARVSVRPGEPVPNVPELDKKHDHEPQPWLGERNLFFNALRQQTPGNYSDSLYNIYLKVGERYPEGITHLPFQLIESSMRRWRRVGSANNSLVSPV